MEKKYYREDVVIEFNSIKDVWEISDRETGEFIACAERLIQLINEYNFLK